MQKLLFLLLFQLILPLTVFAAPEITTQTLTYDFDEVPQGDKVSYTFSFKNSGDEILEISSVSSSCGCTAALLSSKRIAPGDTGQIKATFDSSRFRGRVTKTITMSSNAASNPQVYFKLQGVVKELLSVSTTRISWIWQTADQRGTSEVLITNQSQQQIVLRQPTSTSSALSATLDRLKLAPGEKATLAVKGAIPGGEKRLNGYLLIGTNFKPMPQIRISVSGRLKQ
ncbi:MAG: DUF1573 domain-containing protein [Geopsychrobacter sp.]|nr:DUF1573 domain-containing protein [Geopsychrobacter sp.]